MIQTLVFKLRKARVEDALEAGDLVMGTWGTRLKCNCSRDVVFAKNGDPLLADHLASLVAGSPNLIVIPPVANS